MLAEEQAEKHSQICPQGCQGHATSHTQVSWLGTLHVVGAAFATVLMYIYAAADVHVCC